MNASDRMNNELIATSNKIIEIWETVSNDLSKINSDLKNWNKEYSSKIKELKKFENSNNELSNKKEELDKMMLENFTVMSHSNHVYYKLKNSIINENYKVNKFEILSGKDNVFKTVLADYKKIKAKKEKSYLILMSVLEENNFVELSKEIKFSFENILQNTEKFISFFEKEI